MTYQPGSPSSSVPRAAAPPDLSRPPSRRATVSAIAIAVAALLAPALSIDLLAQSAPVDQALADLQRRREALIRAYDLEAERPRLDEYVRIITRAFRDPAIARQDPIGRLPFVADDRREFLERTAAFVAGRLGVHLSSLTVKYSRLPKGTAGRVKLVDDGVTVEVADRHRDDDEEILAIVAHEFGHIVLEMPGSGVQEADANDEGLADATIVMAGMGPLFLRASYREGLSASGGKAEWSVRRTGSLHPVAIAYLTLVQAEMAGLTAEARRSLIGNWLEPAWSVRARVR
jgi:hypothetical protein